MLMVYFSMIKPTLKKVVLTVYSSRWQHLASDGVTLRAPSENDQTQKKSVLCLLSWHEYFIRK